MRRIGVVATLAVLTVLAVVVAGWLRSPDPITADEAVDVAEDALDAAGVRAAVADEPSSGSYEPAEGESVEVWKVVATIEGGTVVLWLAQDDSEPVYLDDRAPSGATHLLSDEAYEALADHDAHPARDRLLRENLALTAAAAGVLGVVSFLTTLGVRRLR